MTRRLVVVAVVLALVAAALVGVRSLDYAEVEEGCGDRPLACSVAAGAATSALTATLVSLVWAGGIARVAALRRYRRSMRTDPGRMLGATWAGSLGRLRGRADFVEDIFAELRDASRGEPVLVVADAAVGKTSVLLLLARRLASGGFVPVIVPLRGHALPFDVERLVADAFRRELARQLLTPATIDRISQSVQRSGRLVALLDGLDEADPASPIARRQIEVAAALDPATTRIRTVATSRPSVLSDRLRASMFRVPALAMDDAVAIAQPGGQDGDRVRAVVEAGRLDQAPFFLPWVAAANVDLDRQDTASAIRLEILREALGAVPEAETRVLAALAFASCICGRYEMALAEALQMLTDFGLVLDEFECQRAIDVGQSHAVADLMIASDVRFGFAHAQLVAYFAGVHLRACPDDLAHLADAKLPEAAQAIAWAATADDHERWSAATLATLPSDDAVVTCVRLASTHRVLLPDTLASVDRTATWRVWSAELAMIHELGSLNHDGVAIELLVTRERHPLYEVRWAAARALARGSVATYRTLAPGLRTRVETAESELGSDAFDPRTIQEGPLWYLPSLVAGCAGDTEAFAEASELLRRFEDVVRSAATDDVPGGLGAESSLAQGFKLAALTRPGVLDQASVHQLAETARFWYARVEALHALAFDAIAEGSTSDEAIAHSLRAETHPLVRSVAALAARAVRAGNASRWLWTDDHSIVRAPSTTLADEAVQTLGELVLLLNLSENGVQEVRDRNALSAHLPECLTSTAARARLTNEVGCTASCPFGLCPYQLDGAYGWARGAFGEAFARRMRRATQRVRPPGWYDGRRRDFLVIWNCLERSER